MSPAKKNSTSSSSKKKPSSKTSTQKTTARSSTKKSSTKKTTRQSKAARTSTTSTKKTTTRKTLKAKKKPASSKKPVEPAQPVRTPNEIRKDYLLDEYVLINYNRAKRPHQLKKTLEEKKVSVDPFAPGNELLTPPENGRIPAEGKWRVRWFENLYPLFHPHAEGEREQTTFFTRRPARGYHEVIVDTPRKDKHWETMSTDELVLVLKVIGQEIERLHEQKGVRYVTAFYNRGSTAGASLPHSHTQLVATSFIPQRIDEKIRASASYYRMRRKCAYCMVLEEEKKRKERYVWENERFAIITPYASKYNYEALILPRLHKTSFQEFTEKDYAQLAEAIQYVVKRVRKLGAGYNITFYYERQTKVYKERAAGMHFHVEITPRIQTPAGFEIATRIMVNDIPPEQAAAYYRETRA